MFKKMLSILFSFAFLMSAIGVSAVEPRTIEIDSKKTYVALDSEGYIMGYYFHTSSFGVGPGQTTGGYKVYTHSVWWDFVSGILEDEDYLRKWLSSDGKVSFSQGKFFVNYGYDVHDYTIYS